MTTPLPPRPFDELRDTGLLWLINASVFHPRGYALALVYDDDGDCRGWALMGDGSEPWTFPDSPEIAEAYRRARATLPDPPTGQTE